ncbi:MAG: L,D-transpeptidase family protein [Prevotella sp.]|nr:L,D-transpeptidase family protein [Prevotella sp.]
MLHCEGWQGRTQGVRSIKWLFAIACVLLVSCVEGNREPTEAERSAFGTYVESMDSSLTGKWFDRMGVSSDADSLLAYLRRELPSNGLDSTTFFIPQIAEDLQIVHLLAFDSVGVSINDLLPRLDSLLSKAYVRYTTGQRYGFIQPGQSMKMKSDSSGCAILFGEEVKVPDSKEAERKLTSPDRMEYLLASHPQGHVYQALKAQLAKTADNEERSKIAINMERCRWQMKHPGENERMVLVNIPSQQLWAVSSDSVLDMRICCGALATKSPLLHSEIHLMEVNPEWVIPQSIIKKDIARHGGDSSYFARRRYYIVDRRTGKKVNPAEVSSGQMLSGGVRIAQTGGAGNSLGRIVFRFPNNYAVYLHDTSNRGAFNQERRTLSHGCIRVQKPFELACFMMPEADEWEKDRLRISMDIRPVTERGLTYLREHGGTRLISNRAVNPKVPVYIVYYTAYPNPKTGLVELWPDLYGYDKIISRELSSILL